MGAGTADGANYTGSIVANEFRCPAGEHPPWILDPSDGCQST